MLAFQFVYIVHTCNTVINVIRKKLFSYTDKTFLNYQNYSCSENMHLLNI